MINMAQYLVLLWSTVISILLLNSITFCFLMFAYRIGQLETRHKIYFVAESLPTAGQ